MKFSYVGWVGFGNLGDDVIAEALLDRLRPDEVVYARHDVRGIARDLVTRTGGDRHLLLGGGTAIGRRNWRGVIEAAALSQARRRPRFMIGAGVEDPSFAGRNSFSGNDELRRWRRTLSRFDRVTVRGPRSAELLAGIDVDATVVGDPALLLEPATAVRADGVLAICMGFGDDMWGHAPQRAITAASGLARRHAAAGGRVRLLVMNDEDAPAAREIARAIGGNATGDAEIVRTTTSAEFFTALAGVEMIVSQRLHGAVLAAAAGVPVVALEYQPKCRDFMASIGQDDLALRCDTVTPESLIETVEAVRGDRAARVGTIDARVGAYRAALAGELDRIREVAGGAPTPAPATDDFALANGRTDRS